MTFTLIRGTFHVIGSSPDGDSVRFRARSKRQWEKLAGRARVRKNSQVQVRFEGIDALETHFGSSHQPLGLAQAATARTLELLGIHDVHWKNNHVVKARDGKQGYLLAGRCDRQGRPVAFAFQGSPSERDGTRVHLDVKRLRESVNYRLAAEGHAYPIFYDSLYYELRDAIAAAVCKAWEDDRGLWTRDCTMDVDASKQDDLENRYPILPKLFRRISEYRRQNKGRGLAGFKQWLGERHERVLVLSRGQTTHFDSVVWQEGNRIGLDVWPEDLVFYDWRPKRRR